MSNQLFPFHPVTGNRLTATIDFIPGAVHRDISKANGEIIFGEGGGTAINWDGAEEQMQHGLIYLTNTNADECLHHEAVWRSEDVDSIGIDVVGTFTSALTPNQLRDKLAELGSAAREVVLRSDEGQSIQDIGVAMAELKALLDAMGLLELDADE